MAPTLVTAEISVRLQPNSSVKGITKIVRMPMAVAALANSIPPEAATISQP
jgi:hypothetical protein